MISPPQVKTQRVCLMPAQTQSKHFINIEGSNFATKLRNDLYN